MGKMIKSTGPVPCNVMVVAERPGREEVNRGRVLCGPSGQELDRYLLIDSGIDRANVYATNLVKDFRLGENPDPYEIVRDWPLLIEEVQRVRPKYVLAMGLWSTRAFLGNEMELDWCNGLHFPLKWECCQFTVMPVIHSAAGLHRPADAGKIAWGFRQFGKMVRGEALPTGHLSTPIPTTYSDSVLTLDSIIAMDTEGTVDDPWCLSYCCRPGVASVQRGRRHRKWDCESMDKVLVVMHGALHDLPVLARLGVHPKNYTCTLLMAALLGTEPHGLKALARRHAGMRMSAYSDIVAPARREKGIEFLGRVVDWTVTNEPQEARV